MAAWFKRLDLAPVFPLASSSKRRYIFRDGRPRRWPLSIAESIGLAGRFGRRAVTRIDRRARARNDGGVGRPRDRRGRRASGCSSRRCRASTRRRHRRCRRARSSAAASAGRGGLPRRAAAWVSSSRGSRERLRDRGVRFDFNRAARRIEAGVPTVIAHRRAGGGATSVAPHAPTLAGRIGRRPHGAAGRRSRCSLSRTRDDVRGFGVLFPAAVRRARARRAVSTPTSSKAAARGDRKRGSSAIAMQR